MEQENNSISLSDIFRVIKKNILIIISIVLVATILGAVYTFKFTTPLYRSTSSIIVQVPISNDEYDISASLKFVDTVKDALVENEILGPVEKQFKMDKGTLRGKVSFTNTEYSSLIRIHVTDVDGNRAIALANAIAKAAISESAVDNPDGLLSFAAGYIKQPGTADAYSYVSPNKPLLLMCSVLIGAVISFAIVFIKEFMSKKFKSKADVESYLPNDKIIGTFVNNKELEAKKDKSKGHHHHHSDKYEYLFKLIEPTIRQMEPYNKLLTNITYSNIDNPYRRIMVTSTTMNELKSTTIANLAYCMANNNKKVIIVDLDLRLSTVHKFFKISKDNGLVEYLDGSITLEEAIKHTEEGIDVITSGKMVINPVVILESIKLKELLDKLSEEYDYILIDTPPVSACTDALLASKLIDGVIYNISINQANKQLVKESIKQLKDVKASIIGLNLTKLEESSLSEYYSYYYSEYNKETRVIENNVKE